MTEAYHFLSNQLWQYLTQMQLENENPVEYAVMISTRETEKQIKYCNFMINPGGTGFKLYPQLLSQTCFDSNVKKVLEE